MRSRLADETSPYLQQHAANPVDWYPWYPWGAEALALARASERPILLSVGYSACHWCHVMAHECFEDDDTAALMNRHFVNIKVDREERGGRANLNRWRACARGEQGDGHSSRPVRLRNTDAARGAHAQAVAEATDVNRPKRLAAQARAREPESMYSIQLASEVASRQRHRATRSFGVGAGCAVVRRALRLWA